MVVFLRVASSIEEVKLAYIGLGNQTCSHKYTFSFMVDCHDGTGTKHIWKTGLSKVFFVVFSGLLFGHDTVIPLGRFVDILRTNFSIKPVS